MKGNKIGGSRSRATPPWRLAKGPALLVKRMHCYGGGLGVHQILMVFHAAALQERTRKKIIILGSDYLTEVSSGALRHGTCHACRPVLAYWVLCGPRAGPSSVLYNSVVARAHCRPMVQASFMWPLRCTPMGAHPVDRPRWCL